MALYVKGSAYPASLPFRIRLSDGRTRTDPSTFTAAEIADAGYTAAPSKPAYDPATQSLGWDGTGWTVEAIPLADLRAAKAAALAEYRWQQETGGLDLPGGGRVHTDRTSQAMINGAYSSLAQGFVSAVEFKGESGWMTLDLSAVTAIAQAVAGHVQACFAAEKAVAAQIEAEGDPASFDVQAAFDAAMQAGAAE